MVDVFGNYTDGTGSPWEYYEGWAKRIDLFSSPSDTFDPDQWVYSGNDALNNPQSNQRADRPFRVELEG